VSVQGSVKDKDTNEALIGLQVSVYSETDSVCVATDENGKFDGSLIAENSINIKIIDVDGAENGSYGEYDTSLTYTDHIIEFSLPKN